MYIKNLKLKNFRCFASREFSFNKRFVLIEGKNGSGKTTLLEALHYACYLRSFRTHLNRDLVRLGDEKHFFLSVGFHEEQSGADHKIQIGASGSEKIVKFDERPIKTYKDLLNHYRVITLSEDDLALVQGAPEGRRSFLNQALMLSIDGYLTQLRTYKQVVSQRNSLLVHLHEPLSDAQRDEVKTWSKQMWEQARTLQQERRDYLAQIESIINKQLLPHFETDDAHLSITITYKEKQIDPGEESFDVFWQRFQASQLAREVAWNRSLFGAHLDDFVIEFAKKRARIFASRGQQKLIVFLIKLAQLEAIGQTEHCVLLLDDFITDFDSQRVQECAKLLNTLPDHYQIFITSPLTAEQNTFFQDVFGDMQKVQLDEGGFPGLK